MTLSMRIAQSYAAKCESWSVDLVRGGPRINLGTEDRDDHAPGGDQRATSDQGKGRGLAKFHPGDHLSAQEKQDDVYAQQPPEIPAGNIDYQSVTCEGSGSDHERESTCGSGGAIEG